MRCIIYSFSPPLYLHTLLHSIPSAMNRSIFFHLLCIFFTCFSVTTTNSLTLPPLSSFSELKTTKYQSPETLNLNEDVHTYFYQQTLDHFNYLPGSYKTFKQRYFVNFKYWGGANSSAPILVSLGGETEMEYSPDFMTDNAALLKALLVYIEHRYYGKSVPFESREAFKNASTLGYFNSAQALQDYADNLIHLKTSLDAQKSPVIVIGGSYSGMLAAWFRLKYPHVTIGALASSAPLLHFDKITPQNAYLNVVARLFKEASDTCYKYIRSSWSEIDQVGAQPNGLSILSQRFNTCYPLDKSEELKDYLKDIYTYSAQYDDPLVTAICEGIDGAAFGNDILSRIYGGLVAYHGKDECNVNHDKYTHTDAKSFSGWGWQICTEMVMPSGIVGNSTMFQPKPFNYTSYAENCKKEFGVSPRPHWITSYYGGHSIKLILRKFASNIIFSNGLRDPWSSGGVLSNLSDTLIALLTVNGTHTLDIQAANKNDPGWLVIQRKKEVEIIQGWIMQYYADLDASME